MSDVKEHNLKLLSTLAYGDAVEFRRGLYSHWGVFIGYEADQNGVLRPRIVHLTSREENVINPSSGCSVCGLTIDKAVIKNSDFFDVAKDCKAYKNNSKDVKFEVKPVQDIIQYAKSKEGNTNYNVFWQNCEHFVSMCRNGVERSDQVNTVIRTVIGTVIGVFGFAAAILFALKR